LNHLLHRILGSAIAAFALASISPSPAMGYSFESPQSTKISAGFLGVFTRAALVMWCDMFGGSWESRNGWDYDCYMPPKITVTDSNLAERAVASQVRYSCAPPKVVADTGWTTGKIEIPPELHEYSQYQSGYIKETAVLEVRQLQVRIWSVRPNTTICDEQKIRYIGVWRDTDRQPLGSCFLRGNPTIVKTGEKVDSLNLGGVLGFPISLRYGSLSNSTLADGLGNGWRFGSQLNLRYTAPNVELAIPEALLFSNESGDLTVFLRSGGQWINSSYGFDNLSDIVDESGGLAGWALRRDRGVFVFDAVGNLQKAVTPDGVSHRFEWELLPHPLLRRFQSRG
jgi:hypothetical protein